MPSLDFDNIYMYHTPNGDQTAKYIILREKVKEFALLIRDLCPDSRERSVAFTNLEQVVMWANASIARN